jgi:hypothetical protein
MALKYPASSTLNLSVRVSSRADVPARCAAEGDHVEDRAADQGDDGHTDCDESTPTCPAPDTKDQTVSWDKIRPDPREQGDVVRQPVGDRATFTH